MAHVKLTQEHFKVLARTKAITILEALANTRDGLRFTDILYDVYKGAASPVLKGLLETDLIRQDVDSRYYITSDGRYILNLCKLENE